MSTPRPRIRVLCVDDHRIVLDGLSLLIRRQRDMEVVGCAATGEEAVDLFREHKPDVTLMDLQMPSMSGLEAIRLIRREHDAAKVVVLTMYQGDEDIYRALQAGAAAYVLKDSLSDDLVRVVREVHAGKPAVAPELTARLVAHGTHPTLTAREVDVVNLISKGMRNKEIAVVLGISEETVKVHVKSVLFKLNAHDRSAVVAIALRRGIIHLGS